MAENPSFDDRIAECQGLVRFLAQQVRSRTPSWVEMDDLISYGQVGLLQAARDFDATRSVKFSTFAYYRIRGAIYDGVNKLMWFRAVRDPENKYNENKYNQMADSLIETTSSESSVAERTESDELSREAGWFSRTTGTLAMSYLTSSDAANGTPDIEDKSAQAPWSGIVERETHSKLAEAINQLPPETAALIRAVYYEDHTLQEAANQLKISKSWASRMHARALEQMARYLKELNVTDSPIQDHC